MNMFVKNAKSELLDSISHKIIGSAIEVHRVLGPGLLESTYTNCLCFEMEQLGLKVEQEKPLPVMYKKIQLDCGYRLDLQVEDKVIVEVKSVENITTIHQAQLLSYLKLSGCKVGLLINFNVKILRHGIYRMVV